MADLDDPDFLIPTDDGEELRGTLRLPRRDRPVPAVLLLPGSGKLDRDSNTQRIRIDVWHPLVERLSDLGIASLRYDRRGVGASSGTWATTGFLRNRDDARAALTALRDHDGVDAASVAVVGHSEGALHAAALAAHDRPAAAVLLAGFAGTGVDAARWQARRIGETLPWGVRAVKPLMIRAMERRIAKHTRPGAPQSPKDAWWSEMLRHDSRDDLRSIAVPTLAVTGEWDLQVDPDDLDAMAELAPGRIETRREPRMTHLLRRADRPVSVLAYRRLLKLPTDPELSADVADWLAARLTRTS